MKNVIIIIDYSFKKMKCSVHIMVEWLLPLPHYKDDNSFVMNISRKLK